MWITAQYEEIMGQPGLLSSWILGRGKEWEYEN